MDSADALFRCATMSTEHSTCFEDRIKLAWVAGLLEGEGSFMVKGDKHRSVGVKCNMTDEDTIVRLAEWTGLGKTNGPYLEKYRKRKPVWVWNLSARADVYRLCQAILPLMGLRRSVRIREVIAHCEAARPTQSHNRKLSREQVLEIRRREYRPRKLAVEFGVSEQTIRELRCGRSYREIA